MKRLALIALALGSLLGAAHAETAASIPSKFNIPWANSAVSPYIRTIPQASQIGITNCAASLTDGFPPLTFTPQVAGGCPPFGADMNGILKQVTQWSQWQQMGAPVTYDSGFSSSIGGYPNGAVLRNATISSCYWISTADNNTSNPDSAGANWIASCPGGGIGGTSTGSANAQTITATPFVTQVGTVVSYVAGFSNTAAMTVTINGVGPTQVYRRSQLGTSLSVGGETAAGQPVQLSWDGSHWLCISCDAALVGEIRDFSGSAAPNGWMFIDGSCKSQATYADLFTVVGSTYGSCSAGNFHLPDGRGNVLAGKDNMGSNGAAGRLTSQCSGSTLGILCGNEQYALDVANLPTHTSSVFIPSGQGFHAHTYAGVNQPNLGGAGSSNALVSSTTLTTNGATLPSMTGTASFSGSDNAFAVLPPLQVVTKIIRF